MLNSQFSATRTVREYTTKYYLSSAIAYRNRSKDNAAMSAQIVRWKQSIEKNWSHIRFIHSMAETRQDQHFFEVHIDLGQLDPDAVKVELFSNGVDPQRKEMVRQSLKENNHYIYRVSLPAIHAITNYTPRIIPFNLNVSVPLESPQILWQR